MLSAPLYFHTLRYLRPEQILARLRYRFAPPRVPVRRPPNVAQREGKWITPPGKTPSLLGPERVRFLNRESDLSLPASWNANAERLWLYNLHYFDDLVAHHAAQRTAWHETLVAAWIRDNPSSAGGVGWEPYPISLRAVNWIKWALAGNELHGMALDSLATQMRHLRRRIEWHLLGNHLLANAKTLVFGGLFFEGSEADEWLEFGTRLIQDQLREQVLADGGHFERSPMYHALALEDVLDLLNALNAWPRRPFALRDRLAGMLSASATTMVSWLEAMTHPDGEIAFFNDAAIGIAQPHARLSAYATALGVAERRPSNDLQPSGYARLEHGPWCVLFDAAAVGPDYQPGHAHADTLSFELSIDGARLIANSGTSTYEQGEQRTFERSTRAHNTVELDGESSSEVWAAFRVARRARPIHRSVQIGRQNSFAACAHDGYQRLQGRPVHRRSLYVDTQVVKWTDRVEGRGSHRARGFIPLHPGIQVELAGSNATLLTRTGRRLILSATDIPGFTCVQGSYAREFGIKEPRPVLVWEVAGLLPLQAAFTLSFDPSLVARPARGS